MMTRNKKGQFVKEICFLSFNKAREISRKLGIKNCKEWQKYTESSTYNHNIPKAPDYYYERWTNWFDFLGKSTDIRKHKVNDNYFKKWSYNMSYILGFWFADGCIVDGKIFSIKQHRNDAYLMEKISKEMNSSYPIREEENSCCFRINSKTIYDDIIDLGGKERKSLDVEFPNIPKKYLPDFIRGYFDGDGTISEGKKTKDGKFFGYKASICSGSKSFIFQLKKTLEENVPNINITYYEHKTIGGTASIQGRILENDGVVYRLSFSPNNLRKLRDFMYSNRKNELRLIRKYEKFIDAGEYKPAPGDINYMPFDAAKKLILNKNFVSMHDYHKWLKGSDCKVILPASPNVVYEGWKGWSDFLGHNKISYDQLSNMAKENGIQNRRNYYDWIKSVRGSSRGKYPRHPQLVYKEWCGWNKFLQKA